MRLLFILIGVFLIYHSKTQSLYPDVLHYQLDIEVNDLNDTIVCKSIILFVMSENATGIKLDLGSLNKSTGLGMKIEKLNLMKAGSTPDYRLPEYLHQSDIVDINHPLSKGDTAVLSIQYRGIPADGLIISKNKYGHRTIFADNWPDRGHQWMACHDDPADKASVEFAITAPLHYQVVANGIQTDEVNLEDNKKLTRWKEDIPLSTKVMVIGIADFSVNLAGFVDCIPVYNWVYPGDRGKEFFDYSKAKDILPFYINHVGPYAYKKLANVESTTRFGGLENANTIFYTERSKKGDDSSNETLIAHEVAHQWFGDMATEKSFAHLWLSEGFATYFAILYMEDKYGKERAQAILKADRDKIIAYTQDHPGPVVDTTARDFMKLLNPNNYEKGGWVLHMLRCELGDAVFMKAIKKYYARYAGLTADTEDLERVFESVSGKNLSVFFKQWLYTSGNPGLTITWKKDPKAHKVDVRITQAQKQVFNFPLELALHIASHKILKQTVQINQRETSYTFKTDGNPVELMADPDVHLLFNCSISQAQ